MPSKTDTTDKRRKVQEYADGVAAQYDMDVLQQWAKSILLTDWPERALMVMEDPSVLDVPHGYIIRLEARLAALGHPVNP